MCKHEYDANEAGQQADFERIVGITVFRYPDSHRLSRYQKPNYSTHVMVCWVVVSSIVAAICSYATCC
jgi:hypothetical protein